MAAITTYVSKMVRVMLLALCGAAASCHTLTAVIGRPACSVRVQKITAGKSHACGVLTNGTVRCWGANYSGQLGDGTTTFRTAPVEVKGLRDVVTAVAGERHTCALKRDGTVWCWGANDLGQLGVTVGPSSLNGYNGLSSTPLPVPNLKDVQAIASGDHHLLALGKDGAVFQWGVIQELSPVDVRKPFAVAVSGVRHIAAGADISCAATQTDVWCWGDRIDYYLVPRETQPAEPAAAKSDNLALVRLGKSEGLQSLSIGHTAICGIDVRGDVHCWGEKSHLGMGLRATSVAHNVVLDHVDRATGLGIGWHTCAVSANGRISCWGSNQSSEVGDESGPFEYEATRVAGVSSAVEVVVAQSSTCARTEEGRVLCWGENAYGQLGDGTKESRGSPEEVSFCATAPEPVFPAPPPGAHLVAGMQRGLCYGSCPVYSVRIYDDGTVIYRGESYVRVRGGQKASISKSAVDELRQRFRSIDFFGLKETCEKQHTDASWVHVLFREGARARVIDDYHGCSPVPKGLRDLEKEIDRIAGTERWVRREEGRAGYEPSDVRAGEGSLDVTEE